ncbi:hypothetical protein LMOSLCC2755_0465 [Listeria monocytogenes SLCC2755]|nr:hypothetical protein LMOSLCC2755_0465 [Listeria monocytogenes SLCC2755]
MGLRYTKTDWKQSNFLLCFQSEVSNALLFTSYFP